MRDEPEIETAKAAQLIGDICKLMAGQSVIVSLHALATVAGTIIAKSNLNAAGRAEGAAIVARSMYAAGQP